MSAYELRFGKKDRLGPAVAIAWRLRRSAETVLATQQPEESERALALRTALDAPPSRCVGTWRRTEPAQVGCSEAATCIPIQGWALAQTNRSRCGSSFGSTAYFEKSVTPASRSTSSSMQNSPLA